MLFQCVHYSKRPLPLTANLRLLERFCFYATANNRDASQKVRFLGTTKQESKPAVELLPLVDPFRRTSNIHQPFTAPFTSRHQEQVVRKVFKGLEAYFSQRVTPPPTATASLENHEAHLQLATHKPSVLVYHLEQLVHSGFPLAQLTLHPLFVKLLHTVQTQTPQLSPFQIQSLCFSFRWLHLRRPPYWRALAKTLVHRTQRQQWAPLTPYEQSAMPTLYKHHRRVDKPQLSHTHIPLSPNDSACHYSNSMPTHSALKVSHTASVTRPERPLVAEISVFLAMASKQKIPIGPFLYPLLKFLLTDAAALSARELLSVLYCIRRYKLYVKASKTQQLPKRASKSLLMKKQRLANVSSKFFNAASRTLTVRYKDCFLPFIIYLLYEFGYTSVWPTKSMNALNVHIVAHIHRLKAHELCLYVYALYKLRIKNYKILYEVSKHMNGKTLWNSDWHSLSLLLWTLSQFQYYNKPFIRRICEYVEKRAYCLETLHMGALVVGMRRLGIRNVNSWNSVLERIQRKAHLLTAGGLAQIVYGLGCVGIWKTELMEALAKQAIQCAKTFTAKEIAAFLDGCVLLGYYNSVLYTLLFTQLVKNGESLSHRINGQFNRIAFAILLEFPSFVESAPAYINLFLEKHQLDIQHKEYKVLHDDLKLCLDRLSLKSEILVQKGPYIVDGRIKRSEHSLPNGAFPYIAIDFLSDTSYCGLTKSILGFPLLKRRHFELMKWNIVFISCSEWIRLPLLSERLHFLVLHLQPYFDAPLEWRNDTLHTVASNEQLEEAPQKLYKIAECLHPANHEIIKMPSVHLKKILLQHKSKVVPQ